MGKKKGRLFNSELGFTWYHWISQHVRVYPSLSAYWRAFASLWISLHRNRSYHMDVDIAFKGHVVKDGIRSYSFVNYSKKFTRIVSNEANL